MRGRKVPHGSRPCPSMHSGGVCRMFSDVFLTHYNLFPYFFILVGIHICASPTLSVVYISSLLLFFVLCRASDAFPTNFGSRHVVRSSLVCFGFGARRSACAIHLDDILSGERRVSTFVRKLNFAVFTVEELDQVPRVSNSQVVVEPCSFIDGCLIGDRISNWWLYEMVRSGTSCLKCSQSPN